MRRQAREIALQILFQTEFTERVSTQDFLALFEETVDKQSLEYAEMLITGVRQNQVEINSLIQSVSTNWKIDRMSIVDRNLLRLAVYEIKLAANPTEPAVVINEAVEIAKKYGTTDSASFVNGVIDTIAKGK
jgi:transcription antitermination protein NusB